MSSTVTPSWTPAITQTYSPSASPSSDGNSSGSFYKNLFYILIGLLCAFGLVSFLSLLRARRRRRAIINEALTTAYAFGVACGAQAARLGVLAPGVPGYLPMRERRAMIWEKADGSQFPDWWEVEKAGGAGGAGGVGGEGRGGGVRRPWEEDESDEFYPLGVIPPRPPRPADDPIELSTLPFFPNHLAYRPASLQPPPARFTGLAADNLAPLDQLAGGCVEVVTIIRLPIPPLARGPGGGAGGEGGGGRGREDEEEEEEIWEEVIKEWGGVELGIAKMGVLGSFSSSGDHPPGAA